MQKILTVIGARPQFIKASVVSNAISQTVGLDEVILHTGQHFDSNMSDVFFNQLGLPKPDIQLNIHGGNHGEMTGRMLTEIERVLIKHKPDRVLVYGDTNSTLAGALAAAKLNIPVAHIEAGLRSFNIKMPEEVNRILTDQISDLLFCPTDTAINNLEKEGFHNKHVEIFKVGDVMQDAALFFSKNALPPENVRLPDKFILATLHRAENTDNPERLSEIVYALNKLHESVLPVVLPLHPRTRKLILSQGLHLRVYVIEPVGYFEMIWLLKVCNLVVTDSGGLQKEAFFFGKACVTMRDQTEWVELIEIGANELVGADASKIVISVTNNLDRKVQDPHQLYGGGQASYRIIQKLVK
ncbi:MULTISPECIES: non-hydrolyzing UDP-N-acetylglucosamine 2-epimerase [Escherichia]|uniref:UDP-N-acetylglucosamine 2-epimerase n=1 Tax=Escherichia albertii TaxID=208962 RepID=A0A1Y9TI05_ESCAL|nr:MULTISPECIES: UDP-N-acetylglucosamine 2-epimerase (non-hydrolyzing) [Escherichia]ARO72662.1 UDP-N-acetylglucosamine 2-epimerase [Escherichia albertii]ARO72681.1 UDP-N-acetylglucosamine 2-epimerase [Escherichia albertii]ARO72861.1 UDP-N-acetylglucosamine 2-epimerase [Escherichia albertii]ARO72892.1 UDP-N-acetylglucosamine 2-epimerase [Escherichia albertii]ARO72911.1 UDP-N-acetylglucosamine 2-epimerase [Escherichia albertii]